MKWPTALFTNSIPNKKRKIFFKHQKLKIFESLKTFTPVSAFIFVQTNLFQFSNRELYAARAFYLIFPINIFGVTQFSWKIVTTRASFTFFLFIFSEVKRAHPLTQAYHFSSSLQCDNLIFSLQHFWGFKCVARETCADHEHYSHKHNWHHLLPAKF